MDEVTKILIAIGTGVFYFWVLSRRKPAERTPKEAIPPSIKKAKAAPPPPTPKPKPKPKTSFGKVLEELTADKPQDVPSNLKEVSKDELRNPMPLVRKDVNDKINIFEEEEQLRRKQRMSEFQDYKENVILKRNSNLGTTKNTKGELTEIDMEDFMNKLRNYHYKIENKNANAIAKALENYDEVKRALIISEILNRKF